MTKKFLYVDATGVYTEANSYESTDFTATGGAGNENKPVLLDGSGLIDGTMINDGDIAHDSTSGVAASTAHTAFPLLDGTRDFTGIVGYNAHPTFTADTDIVDKKYVDDIALSSEWYPESALSYITDNTLVPPTEVLNDVYVLAADGGAPNAAWDGATAGDIVTFNGTTWDAFTPTTGTKISVDDEPNTAYYLWTGSLWSQKLLEATTASTGLVKVGVDIRIDASAAGDGLGFTTGVLNVNVDDSSIETSADTLQVKALGITNDMLAGSISDDKLVEDYIKTSEVDDVTIEFAGGTLNVKADGINDTHIDFGTGLNQVNAADLPIIDSGSYFTGTDTEAALQELGAAVVTRGTTYTSAGVTKGDLVFISANDTVDNYATITNDTRAIGIAASTQAASNDVVVLANDTIATGVISGATFGDVYYWDGSSLVTSIPSGAGAYVWQAGIAKNATDLHVECKLVKKNL